MKAYNPMGSIVQTKAQQKQHQAKVQEVIAKMGNKWCLHPDNFIKRKTQ